MPRKYKIVLTTYVTAALLALGLWGWAGWHGLAGYERAARYGASRAFEETIVSVDRLSQALKKSPYAFDGGMKSRLCSEIYASAQAAEAAMSTLPFSTQELEQLSGFLNRAGDYAYTLGGRNVSAGFEGEEAELLQQLSDRAEDFSRTLRELQGHFHGGELRMDSRQQSLSNVSDDDTPWLSDSLLAYEQGLSPLELSYDGQYGGQEKKSRGNLSEEEMKEQAAAYAGVSPAKLRAEYAYEGADGRRCYSAGELLVCVSPAGVQTMGQSRLVSEQKLSLEQAEEKAGQWLEERGYEGLELVQTQENGAIARMSYAAVQEGVLYPENQVQIAIAMDDGSVYSFNAEDYSPEKAELSWKLSLQEAAAKLPASLTVQDSRPLIRRSAGGEPVAMYELFCMDKNGKRIIVYLDGKNGNQREIVLQ